MICLGVDQDLHNTGLALLELSELKAIPTILDLDTVTIPDSITGDSAAAHMIANLVTEISTFIGLHEVDLAIIEGVQKYYGTSPARVEDIIRGAYISGAAAAIVSNNRGTDWYIVRPNDWKGSVKKPIHQERILNRLGWKPKRVSTHSYPKKPPEGFVFTSEKWKHIVDAIGLAWWGLKEH